TQKAHDCDDEKHDYRDTSTSKENNLGLQINCDRASNTHQKESRQQQPEVEPLTACQDRIQPVAHISGAIPHSHANQAQIIRKQQPTDGEKCCYEREPARRVAKLCE